MLKINLSTGTVWTQAIYTQGNLNSDLVDCLDGFVSQYGIEALPVVAWDINDLSDDEVDNYIPINGGQYYIEGISSVEEIEEIEGIKNMIITSYSSLRNELYIYNRYNDNLIFTLDGESIEVYILKDGDIDDNKLVTDFYDMLVDLML